MGEKGTGLGLPYSADIVAAHNGSLTVTSDPGIRTVFTISVRGEWAVEI
jgi:signal transduction histidine kinase